MDYLKSKFKIGDVVKLTPKAFKTYHGYPDSSSEVTKIDVRQDDLPVITTKEPLCVAMNRGLRANEKHLELVEPIIDISGV